MHYLDDEPGVLSSRYAGPGATYADNCRKLLRRLRGVPHRRRGARFRCGLARVSGDGAEEVVEGVCSGVILEQPRGAHGFGYDPVFLPRGHTQTFAEMESSLKNSISHRGLAFRECGGFSSSIQARDAPGVESPRFLLYFAQVFSLSALFRVLTDAVSAAPRAGLAPAWSHTVEGVIWRIAPAEAGLLVGETRNLERKTASFFCLDCRTGAALWEGVVLSEGWWVGIEAVFDGVLFVHGFASPELPAHRGITALDLHTGSLSLQSEG